MGGKMSLRSKLLKDPNLEGYITEDGENLKLNKFITDELINLGVMYTHEHGQKPPKELIRSWHSRLKLAYHEMIITDKE